MTTSVADKTPIPDKVWRRHTDPPSLWVGVAIGSVSLHLLAFWLMRSLNVFQLPSQKSSQAPVPIELIEISPTAKSRTRVKPVAPNSPVTKLPKPVVEKKLAVKPTVSNIPDQNAIAQQFERQQQEQFQRQQQEQFQRQQQEQFQRQQQEQFQRQQQEQFQRQQQEQFQRQQQEQFQRQQQEQFQRQQQEQFQRQQQEQFQRQQQEQFQRQQQEQTDSQQQSSPTDNAPSGTLLASLVGEPQQVQSDRHAHPAKIKPTNQPFSKGLEYVNFIERQPGQPVEFTAILTISEKGKLEKILIADEAVSVDERPYYEDFVADQVFKNWEFEPAYDNDPNDPKPSDLMVRIRIQPLPNN